MPDRRTPAIGAGVWPLAIDPQQPADSPAKRAGTVLAFDFGEKRIGVAVGEREVALAHPLTTIHAAENKRRFDAIAALVDEWRPMLLVVGLPLHMDDSAHALTARATRFARQLEGRFKIPCVLVDERMTTREATDLLHDAGIAARRQKPLRDQVAAQRILQSYFDIHDRH